MLLIIPACKVAHSETISLDINPKSLHCSTERKLVNSEPLNPSGKASEKLICHEIMMRLFPKFSPFHKGLGNRGKGFVFLQKREKEQQ